MTPTVPTAAPATVPTTVPAPRAAATAEGAVPAVPPRLDPVAPLPAREDRPARWWDATGACWRDRTGRG